MKKTKWLLLSILLFLALSPSLALAAGTGGGGGALPWETPLQNVQQSLTGPVAKGVALVAIVGALGTLLFLHAEMNQFTRVIVFIVMGIGTLVGANAFLSGSGAGSGSHWHAENISRVVCAQTTVSRSIAPLTAPCCFWAATGS